MVFDDADPIQSGHNALYLCHLLQWWGEARPTGRLDVAIYSNLANVHPRLGALLRRTEPYGVRLVPLEEFMTDEVHGSTLQRIQKSTRLLKKCVDKYKPQRCLLMYFDQFRLPLACRLRFRSSVELSGIYFSPTFHYGLLKWGRVSLKEHMRQWRNGMLIGAALRHPAIRRIFCLDPYAVSFLQEFNKNVEIVALADPVEIPEKYDDSIAELRKELDVRTGTKVLLVLGVLGRSKGIEELLTAVGSLSETTARQLCLLLVGRMTKDRERALADMVASLRKRGAQIIVVNKLVREEAINSYYALADLVVLPYRRHAGSSGSLMRAAAAGKAVLGPDYGLIGELIRRYHLGWTMDSTSPRSIAHALEKVVRDKALASFDEAGAREFARAHSAGRFGSTIFTSLLRQE